MVLDTGFRRYDVWGAFFKGLVAKKVILPHFSKVHLCFASVRKKGKIIFSMKLTVKLFGTLSEFFPDYDFNRGLEVDLPPDSKVADLLEFLNISEEQGGTVLKDSRFLSPDEILTPGDQVLIFQALNGG
jgi:sulfur carrier protein ThiS